MAKPTQNERPRFPAWRLPKGVKNASDDELEIASASCESWEIGCAGVVVAAVATEFLIAGIHPPYDSFLEQWGSAAANAFVALGIVGEVVFSGKDGRIQTELRSRSNEKLADAQEASGEATERASAAMADAMRARQKTAEIYAKFSARHLTPDQKAEFGKFVSAAGLVVRLSYGGSSESAGLYNDFVSAVHSSEVELRFEDAGDDPPHQSGILVSAADSNKARALWTMLEGFGFEHVRVVDHGRMPLNPALAKRNPEMFRRKQEEPAPVGEVWVHIAAMPVPEPPDPELPPEVEMAMRRAQEESASARE